MRHASRIAGPGPLRRISARAPVLTYQPQTSAGSWLETCTLPGSDKAECTATLNAFVSWYGQR